LAGFGARVAADDPAWEALRTLAAQGAWIKLPDASWGSDWPHTMFPPHAMPTYASTWRPVEEALGEVAAETLRLRVPSIYL